MTTQERIETEEDFVNIKRLEFSLKRTVERYPDGTIPDRILAQALGMKEEDVEPTYQRLVVKLRKLIENN